MALQMSSYSFPGSPGQSGASRVWLGPTFDSTSFDFYHSNPMWSPCMTTPIAITNELYVVNLFFLLPHNGFVVSHYHEIELLWRECT
ncbi:hypothetical protein BDZ91DRAFT_753546 [Kalaharituber pfeilii]|nr:hypothetical protein BDZ91DRAFT_753546 [Kalaharituber pfeilii]